jgi:YVTN family beta-propeller protein
VSVVDVERHEVVDTIPIQGENVKPMGVVVSPDGDTVYVATGRGASVAVIDASSGEVASTIPVGTRPWGIALTPDGRKLYTANGPGNDVSVVDVASGRVVATVPAGDGPWGVVVGPRRLQDGGPAGAAPADSPAAGGSPPAD